jgi:serine/threonine-protein kinase
VVHLAQHRRSDEIVAIKLWRDSVPHAMCLRQARLECGLRHPHIVGGRLVEDQQGRSFWVMPLMEGGVLTWEFALRRTLEERLELALQVARAVQFAHEHGVLYRDIKADNILLDAEGKPHISDFSLAQAIQGVDDGVRGGTRGWMAPEQERGEPVTTAVDVFALGVLIHWLTLGELPASSGITWQPHEPTRPRAYWPDLSWGMLAVAQRAMQAAPHHRYASVAGLCEDLERARDWRPLLGVPLSPMARIYGWARRHQSVRRAVVASCSVFAVLASLAARSQADGLRASALAMNAYAANGQAAAVLFRLRDYANELERAARDSSVLALVQTSDAASDDPNPCASRRELSNPAPLRPYRGQFSSLMVLDRFACARARMAEDTALPDFIGHPLNLRDYFLGAALDAQQPTRTTWVRKAYLSSVSHLVRFAISTPLLSNEVESASASTPRAQDRFAGALTGSITVASTLDVPGALQRRWHDQITALVGPFEDTHQASSGQVEYAFLSHPKLARGARAMLPPSLAQALSSRFGREGSPPQFALRAAEVWTQSDYTDPLAGERWLAAFAPVGGTGYVVVVQTRDRYATRPSALISQVGAALGILSAALLLTWGCFLLWARRARRFRVS